MGMKYNAFGCGFTYLYHANCLIMGRAIQGTRHQFGVGYIVTIPNIYKLSQNIYSTHYLKSVEISNKIEFNTSKMAQFTIFTWNEFRQDMHQTVRVTGHYTKNE